ncbi:MAG: hypothetical protein KF691_07420 [Phycisphaeraceae bacterium]|nr:hypothetical protein [Phycisphaeraceae bacterium]
MSQSPVICFGQQPCGFFPRRFLVAKLRTARKLQAEIGGEIVFFYHDSDHDPRETQTTLHHHKTGEPTTLNFAFENKVQRKYTPFYLKRVVAEWHAKTLRQMPSFDAKVWLEEFRTLPMTNIADYCLEMYRRMGMLKGVRVARSGDPEFRKAACDVGEFYADVPYEGEIVRARVMEEAGGKRVLQLHQGGDSFLTIPAPASISKEQISPARDTRLRWMNSVLHCTHYVCGAGEQAYLKKEEAPETAFVNREPIERSDDAYTEKTI